MTLSYRAQDTAPLCSLTETILICPAFYVISSPTLHHRRSHLPVDVVIGSGLEDAVTSQHLPGERAGSATLHYSHVPTLGNYRSIQDLIRPRLLLSKMSVSIVPKIMMSPLNGIIQVFRHQMAAATALAWFLLCEAKPGCLET